MSIPTSDLQQKSCTWCKLGLKTLVHLLHEVMEEGISDTTVQVYCSCHGFLIGQSWEFIVYSMTMVCSTVFLHIQGRMWCCAEWSSFCVRRNIENKVMKMTVVLVNRLGEVWIHSAFVQPVHLLKEQQYQVVLERFSLWKFNIADTLHRPQSGCCCLPTQAAGWGAVIRLERSGWQWPDQSLLVSESRTRLMSRLAGCNPAPCVVRPVLLMEGVWCRPLLLLSPLSLHVFLAMHMVAFGSLLCVYYFL